MLSIRHNIGDFCIIMFGDSGRIGVFTVSYVQCFLASAGGAAVSEKHCGFVINKNAASSQDIYDLIIHIQKKVRKASGVELIPEVRLLGKFD